MPQNFLGSNEIITQFIETVKEWISIEKGEPMPIFV